MVSPNTTLTLLPQNDFPDMSSGSGIGQPGLTERTIARQITIKSMIGRGRYIFNVFIHSYQKTFFFLYYIIGMKQFQITLNSLLRVKRVVFFYLSEEFCHVSNSYLLYYFSHKIL